MNWPSGLALSTAAIVTALLAIRWELREIRRAAHTAIDEFNAAEERRYLARDRKLQELEGMFRAARVELDEIEAEVRARPQDQDHGGASG